MKLILTLFLCGLSCGLASPTCDQSEADKCAVTPGPEEGHFFPETAAELDTFCRDVLKELDCQIAFTERCPNTLLGAMSEGLRMYRTAYGKLCDKELPLREKFLEKGSCLNEEERPAEDRCSERVEEKDYCKRFDPVLECSEEEVNQVCGRDGKDVFAELYKPKYALKKVFCGGS